MNLRQKKEKPTVIPYTVTDNLFDAVCIVDIIKMCYLKKVFLV